jgi:hypothetical protein
MAKRKAEKRWHIIGRGFNGWHATGIDVSSSGGQLDPYEYWTGEKVSGYLAEAIEGALVYDASEADSVAFTRHVMSGPMVNPALPPDGVDRFSSADRAAALRMAPALGGGYQTLAVMAQSEKFTGLDRVGVAVFAGLLRAIPGCKVGKVRKGKVVWDEGHPFFGSFNPDAESDYKKGIDR